MKEQQQWEGVLGFWFPEGRSLRIDPAEHRALWHWRMQGGADDAIITRFSSLTEQAANGQLDHWALDPHGRLALIILLDQFSRSVWRESARAYAQDMHAMSLVNDGFANGHFASLKTPWFKIVYGLPLGHCEGDDHLQRIDLLINVREKIAAEAPIPLQPIYTSLAHQAADVRKVIAAFGRHPHRNEVLKRPSTPSEKAYIAKGEFPHLKAFQ